MKKSALILQFTELFDRCFLIICIRKVQFHVNSSFFQKTQVAEPVSRPTSWATQKQPTKTRSLAEIQKEEERRTTQQQNYNYVSFNAVIFDPNSEISVECGSKQFMTIIGIWLRILRSVKILNLITIFHFQAQSNSWNPVAGMLEEDSPPPRPAAKKQTKPPQKKQPQQQQPKSQNK